MRKPDAQRKWVALATEECDLSPNFSDYTADDEDKITCGLVDKSAALLRACGVSSEWRVFSATEGIKTSLCEVRV
jgi:hypothetical protein